MSDAVIDFSSLESAANTPSEVEAQSTAVDTAEVTAIDHAEATQPEGKETTEAKTNEEKATTEKSGSAKLHEAIKKFRDLDPEGNKTVASELKNMVGRYDAMTKMFPGGVKEAQEFKTFSESVGGKQGIVDLQNIVQAANDTDQLLYNGDPKLLDNIIEDLKANNKLESLGKLTAPMLDKLMEVDPKGYAKAFVPHFVQGLESSGVRDALNAVIGAFDNKDNEGLKKGLSSLASWYNGLLKQAGESKAEPKANPEQESWQKEKAAFESKQISAFQTELENHLTTGDNTNVLDAMKPYFRSAFFKGFPKETLKELHGDIRTAARRSVLSDATNKSQLQHLTKGRDKAKVETFWRTKMQDAATEAAKKVITSRYPGWNKTPGSTAAAAKAAPTAGKVTPNAAPVRVASKPKWEDIDFTKDPNQLLMITGKAYLKTGRFVSWK